MEGWHIWAILAIILLIAEVFTSGFAVACLAVGAIGAAAASAAGAPLIWQGVIFCIISVLAFIAVRPLLMRYFYAKGNIKTNADALVGRIATVTRPIGGDHLQGRVALDGEDWVAESEDGSPLENGERVEVTRVSSTVLTVRQINHN